MKGNNNMKIIDAPGKDRGYIHKKTNQNLKTKGD